MAARQSYANATPNAVAYASDSSPEVDRNYFSQPVDSASSSPSSSSKRWSNLISSRSTLRSKPFLLAIFLCVTFLLWKRPISILGLSFGGGVPKAWSRGPGAAFRTEIWREPDEKQKPAYLVKPAGIHKKTIIYITASAAVSLLYLYLYEMYRERMLSLQRMSRVSDG